jgi:hypothetical protein
MRLSSKTTRIKMEQKIKQKNWVGILLKLNKKKAGSKSSQQPIQDEETDSA